MLAAIDEAREYVLLEMYLVNSCQIATRFCNALIGARARGARTCVLFDGFGSLGFRRADRRRLLEAGVDLRFFNPLKFRKRITGNLLRDHRKLLIADKGHAAVGDQQLAVVTQQVAGDALSELERVEEAQVHAGLQQAPAAQRHGSLGRLSLSEARARSDLATDVLRRIDTAAARAWIMSAYFVPSRRLRTALRRAARRGVDVRLLLPGPRTDHPWVRQAARRFYGKLLRNGVKIWEYQPSMLHAKMILCDDWVSVGSANLDRWSFRWNLEANQEIDSAAVADAASALFERDFVASRAVSRHHWGQRGRLDRLRENIAGRLDRLLDSWRHP